MYSAIRYTELSQCGFCVYGIYYRRSYLADTYLFVNVGHVLIDGIGHQGNDCSLFHLLMYTFIELALNSHMQ